MEKIVEKHGNLTTLQRKAVNALMETDTITAAADAAGCAQSSIYNWLKDPVFNAELLRLENVIRNKTGRILAKDSEKALDVIRELMTNDRTDKALRFRSACAWLDYMIKTQDQADIERRLSALEALEAGRKNE